jgi:hypothetical protein
VTTDPLVRQDDRPLRKPGAVLRALEICVATYPSQRVAQIWVNALGPLDHFYLEDEQIEAELLAYAARAQR